MTDPNPQTLLIQMLVATLETGLQGVDVDQPGQTIDRLELTVHNAADLLKQYRRTRFNNQQDLKE